MTKDRVTEWLLVYLERILGLPRTSIDLRDPFSTIGLDSAAAVGLAGDLERWLGVPLEPTIAFAHPTIDALAAHLASGALVDPAVTSGGGAADAIAIVGIGCRFPAAHGPGEFWDLLRRGVDAVSEIPGDRWHADDFYDANVAAPGKATTRWGGFLADIDAFDARFFGISPGEAERMDPQQRLLLEVSWEALEDAGVAVDALAGSATGVFVGISTNEYARWQLAAPREINGYTGTGNALSVAANRISYCYDLHGPSIAVDTACSSSLLAVHLACRSLRSEECTLALAGGVNLMLAPEVSIGFSKAGMMSPRGRCRTFDAGADGYVRGEGCGVVVLKPLARARLDGDKIYAVVRGSAVNQDGRTNGLTAPNPRAQQAVLQAAHRDAGVAPATVAYVEAHGTGTAIGDVIEAQALGAVLSTDRPPGSACWVGSAKTNIGHLEAAAGVAGLIKVALALYGGSIPPSLHFEKPNPRIDFGKLGLRVPTEPIPWPEGPTPPRAGVSAFGFGGTNVHVVCEQASSHDAAARPSAVDGSCLVPFSARSRDGLRALLATDVDWLANGHLPSTPDGLFDLAHTLARRRSHLEQRVAIVASSAEGLLVSLRARLAALAAAPGARPRQPPSLLFVFSGQGSQWPGMGRQLLNEDPAFATAYLQCDEALRPFTGWSLLADITRLDAEELSHTTVAQPAIFAFQIALAAMLRSWGVEPSAVVGHSLGEITAACVAGALDLDEAARIVARRSHLMEPYRGRGRMLAVDLTPEDAHAATAGLAGRVSVAAENGPRSVVLAGDPDALEELRVSLERSQRGSRWVRVEYAFHGPDMAAAGPALEADLGTVRCRPPTIPFYSAVTGEKGGAADLDAVYWGRNVVQPVRFLGATRAAIRDGRRVVVELSPHPILTDAVKQIVYSEGVDGGLVVPTGRRDGSERESLLKALGSLYEAGSDVRWRALYPEGRLVDLPSRPWIRQRYWFRAAHDPTVERDHGAAATNGSSPLGTPVAVAGDVPRLVWQRDIDATKVGALRDHQVGERVVLPASLTVDLALLAATAQGIRVPCEIADLTLTAPIVLEDGARLETQVQIEPQDGERVGFRLFSRRTHGQANGNDGWTLHATATVRPRTEPDPPTVSEPLPSPPRADGRIDPGAFYARLHRSGLHYGPAFQGVRALWRDGPAVWARVAVAGENGTPHVVDPFLLDAAFQVLAAAHPDFDGREDPPLFVPVGVDRIVIHRALADRAVVQASRRDDGGDATGFAADVRLFDEDGGVLAEVVGLRLRRMHERAASTTRPDGTFVYRTRWREAAPPVDAASREGRPAGRWLLWADDRGVARELARRLGAAGDRCTLLYRGGEVAGGPGDDAVVWPTDPAARQMTLRRFFDVPDGRVHGAVYLWPLDAPSVEPGSPEAPPAIEATRVLLETMQSIASSALSKSSRLWLVTRRAQPITPADGRTTGGLAQAALIGLTKAAAFELPDLQCRRIDLDGETPRELADQLAAELGLSDEEDQVAVRAGVRLVPRLEVRPPRADGRSPHVRAGGTYLVTGGLGGLGLVVAQWLVRRGARHVVLVGRRPPSDATRSVIEMLGRGGAEVTVRQTDVAVLDEVRAVVREIAERGAPLRGVVHAAGVLDDGPLMRLKADGLARVMAPKALGAWNLHHATLGAELDFFVLFSSATSVLGSPGQANYIAANAFLDCLAHHRRAVGLPALAVNWGPWAKVGMAAERNDRDRLATAVSALDPDVGIAVLEQLLAEREAQAVVLPYDLRNLIQFYPAATGVSLFEDLLGEDMGTLRGAGSAAGLMPRPDLATPYVAPSTDTERVIATLWQRALGVECVGVSDSFFDLGGDSVFASQLVIQINQTFGVSVDVERAFERLTVGDLAALVEEQLLARLDSLTEDEAAALLAGTS